MVVSTPYVATISILNMPIGSMNPRGSPQLQGSPSQRRRMTSHSQINRGNRGGEDRNIQPLIRRPRLHELLGEVHPDFQLDEDVQDMLIQMADDFVDTTLTAACAFAKNRRARTVELKDIQLHLERYWDMWIPGLGNNEFRPAVNEAHKQRMTLIRKTINK